VIIHDERYIVEYKEIKIVKMILNDN